MKKRCTAIALCFLVLGFCSPAWAQGKGKKKAKDDIDMPSKGGDIDMPPVEKKPKLSDRDLKRKKSDIKPTTPLLTTTKRVEARRTWKDIVVIPRKPFLKKGRFDLSPFFGATMNDNIIQHYSLGAEMTYHITDVLAVSLLGMYYFKDILDQEFFTRYHYKRVPSMNKYNYTVTLNFSYVPIYGKLALFNQHLMHFEAFVMAGVGGSGTEIVPKDYRYKIFSNPFALTFPVGIGGRVFINKWIAIQASVRDYMMVDKFEGQRGSYEGCPTTGDSSECEMENAKENAKTRFINNIQFHLGVCFYLPTDFQYTTFR